MFVLSVRRALKKSKTLRYGVPMMVLIVGGSFGLREFSQIRYDAVKVKLDPEFEEKLKRNTVSLESEYEHRYIWLSLSFQIINFLTYFNTIVFYHIVNHSLLNHTSVEEHPISLYKKIKDSAFDDWKNIRGPRPWEDPDLLQGRNPETLKSKQA
ncbi:cytochrome c oxidase assembly protein COX16 homolog, mitochondrial isoform X1 [Monodelphis domestica]|uniref:Cytochrome c oxidase assembly protein COX16 homolog, mitochondrial n=1 Tax=Monodelphis domestica TaxID=13616 RepID=A0A5F8HK11_MONDO|nr:cytochrome c oxidase assembly protein COX16 homolog, mitochondrial isoform X1 [Monodelphis domestica]